MWELERSLSFCSDVISAGNLDCCRSERQGEGDLRDEPAEERPLRHHVLPQEPPHQSLRESGLPAQSRGTAFYRRPFAAQISTLISIPPVLRSKGRGRRHRCHWVQLSKTCSQQARLWIYQRLQVCAHTDTHTHSCFCPCIPQSLHVELYIKMNVFFFLFLHIKRDVSTYKTQLHKAFYLFYSSDSP